MSFKIIQEFPRWEINEFGYIRGVKSKKEKHTFLHKQGYICTHFKKNGKSYNRKVHRLVALTFLPQPDPELLKLCESKWPYKPCVNHIDHNKLNNHVSNLEWCDVAMNNKAAMDKGVIPPLKGQLNGRSKLTDEEVHEICRLYEEGLSPKEVVALKGISQQQATKIRAGFNWSHISSQYNIKVNRRTKKVND